MIAQVANLDKVHGAPAFLPSRATRSAATANFWTTQWRQFVRHAQFIRLKGTKTFFLSTWMSANALSTIASLLKETQTTSSAKGSPQGNACAIVVMVVTPRTARSGGIPGLIGLTKHQTTAISKKAGTTE